MECFELIKNQLIHDQQILRPELQTDATIRDKIYRAVRMVPECNLATFKPTITFQAACEDIRNAISIRSQTRVPQAFVQDEYSDDDGQHGSFYTDRRFHGQKKRWERPTRGGQRGGKLKPGQRQKICFVCKKVGCWSTNHTEEERRQSIQRFNRDKGFDDKKIHQCITEFEGLDPDTSKDYEQFINELHLIDDDDEPTENHISSVFTTASYGEVDGEKAIQMLECQSVMHAFSKLSVFPKILSTEASVNAFLSSRYSTDVFMGIMIDTGAAVRSTAGQDQFHALQQIQDIKLDKSRAGEAKIQFGIGATISLGTTDVVTPIGKITFHVVPADTPFLLCLKDLDDLRVKFDNLENVLIQHDKRTPIVRAYGHPWMLLDQVKALTYTNQSIDTSNDIVTCYFTETELRQLHRRVGHPSARRMHKVLERAGHETNFEELAKLTRFCERCQTH
jgi:hypothetical protein